MEEISVDEKVYRTLISEMNKRSDGGMLVALSLKAQTWHVRRFGRYSKYCDDVVCVQHGKGAS